MGLNRSIITAVFFASASSFASVDAIPGNNALGRTLSGQLTAYKQMAVNAVESAIKNKGYSASGTQIDITEVTSGSPGWFTKGPYTDCSECGAASGADHLDLTTDLLSTLGIGSSFKVANRSRFEVIEQDVVVRTTVNGESLVAKGKIRQTLQYIAVYSDNAVVGALGAITNSKSFEAKATLILSVASSISMSKDILNVNGNIAIAGEKPVLSERSRIVFADSSDFNSLSNETRSFYSQVRDGDSMSEFSYDESLRGGTQRTADRFLRKASVK